MKHRRAIALLLTLLLLIAALQGCMPVPDVPDTTQGSLPTETTETTEPTEKNHTPYTEFERPEEAFLPETSFGELRYERCDVEALREAIDAVRETVEAGADSETILSQFMPVYEDYVYFGTMAQYAYIRYTLDLNDTYFDTEYNWCEEQSPLVEQSMEKCYIAMAQSEARDALERDFFGSGFFAYFDDNEVYSNDRVVELMQSESELQAQYMALQSDMSIVWNGEECLVDELLGDPDLAYEDMLSIYRLYYEKYGSAAAEIYAQLIRLRKQIAEELEYDSYADFAYTFYYDRDYTPAQARQYIADIAAYLPMYYYAAAFSSYEAPLDIEQTQELLQKLAYSFGGEIATAYDYMQAYDLYDFTESTSKMPGSYMTYLPSYGMPFLYVSPTGTIGDLLTATHEFGHFVDGYVNCNATSSIDCAEIFSQGLEFLALNRAELQDRQLRKLTTSKVADSLLVFLSQACYAEFELRAYELPDEELNAQGLQALFGECNEKYGMSMAGLEDILSAGWIDVQHFFIAPMYVISYCISNDAALQIYQKELQDGSGLEAYRALMQNSAGNTVLALLDEAGMESPFADGRIKELAAFFSEQLG